jgi:hypothetical protein
VPKKIPEDAGRIAGQKSEYAGRKCGKSTEGAERESWQTKAKARDSKQQQWGRQILMGRTGIDAKERALMGKGKI